MEDKTLTEEQKKALNKVVKTYFIGGFLMTFKYCSLMISLSILVAAANVFYVKSESFPFFITMVNFIFIAHFMMKEASKRAQVFRESIKKIVDQEEK